MGFPSNIGAYPADTNESTAGWDQNIGSDQQDLFNAGAPVWGTLPKGRSFVAGSTLTFDIACTGTATITYQWYKNGVSQGGQTGRVLTIAGCSASDAGDWYCIATNSVDSSQSLTVYLSVRDSRASEYWTPNIGAGQRAQVPSEWYDNIGACPMNDGEISIPLSGTINGTGSLSGSLTSIPSLSGTITAAGALTPAPELRLPVSIPSGEITAVGSLSGDLILSETTEFDSPDGNTHSVVMGYDVKRQGLNIAIVKRSDGKHQAYFYDLRTGGFYPETYLNSIAPYSMLYYPSNDSDDVGMLFGCKDGYVRIFDPSTTNKDDVLADDSSAGVSSFVCLPVIKLGSGDDEKGIMTETVFELGGGSSGGKLADSDSLTYWFYVGDDYETVLQKLIDGAVPSTTGTLTGPGRHKIRRRIKGAYLGVKIFNSSTGETWAINKIYGNVKPAGRIR